MRSWPATPGPPDGAFTTILKWEAYQAVEYRGVRYGMKSASFAPYQDLPERVGAELELATGGPNTPTNELRRHGWSVCNPVHLSSTMENYQDYIRGSKGEFSIAKEGYVISRSGWMSERTGNYLASGRPALVQDTGFTEWLDCGEGLLAFSTQDEAAAGIEEIAARYEAHCRAAREVAEALYGSDKLLTKLIEDAASLTRSPG